MRLDKVEIVGFKSFCDKQELDFRGGVTGIVGPNGCGKSNISDAISWVLGEQSAKSLRGQSMEDVIFGGSSSRQPVGMAEVNLKVTGLNGSSPDGSPDCTVTRRLYRNGESEYLMNGRTCRLRDIHELFMDTGLGSKAYSIIEQGKIGQILSSKPTDRRALIEEAAGITKYKARRRQTQMKLEAAQQNLLRVNDIVHEVEKQLESLKRQAGKARRYRVMKEEMAGVERVLFGRRHVDLTEQARTLSARMADEGERERSASIALESEEAQMEVRRNALYEDEARAQDVRTQLSELTLAVERNQSRSSYCREQMADAEARGGQARLEAEDLTARVGPLGDELTGRQADEARLRVELVETQDAAQSAEVAVREAAARQGGAETAQEQAREGQVGLLGRIATLQNARESVGGTAMRASADLLKLAAEREEVDRERARIDEALRVANARAEEVETLLSRLREERAAAAAVATAAQAEADALAREADTRQSEFSALRGRQASLEEMVATHSAFDEGVRALLLRPEGLDVLGVVADTVDTDSAYERAVEAFMGDRLQAVLVPDAEQLMRGIRYLESSGAGRGTFLPLASARTATENTCLRETARSEPKVKGLLSDFYRVTGPHADRIRAALPNGFVFETLEDAMEVLARHPAMPAVTLAGETVRGSMVEGGRGGKGLLAPRREIRELSGRLDEMEALLASARARMAEERARAEAASQEAEGLGGRIHGGEKELVAVQHDRSVSGDEHARAARKAGVLDTERAQAEEARGAAEVRLAEIDQALAAAEDERARGAEQLAELGASVVQARAEAEGASAAWSEIRSRLAALRERLAAAEADCARLQRDHQDLHERIAGAQARAQEMDARARELGVERGESERLLAEALLGRDQVGGQLALAEARVLELRNELGSREVALKERRREREMLRDAVTELEVSRARTESDLDHLARECHQAVGVAAAEAAAALTEEDHARDLEGLLQSVQEMREKLDKMGPVNILAVEQAQEHEERHQFLTAQRQDLLDSIAELDSAIKKIDRTSRERFREAFEVINRHFGEVFTQLFGGGTAGLSLLDEEDVLESGIDVMAQPPGKRLQNVMLLSGGEKALTAISLLFAIFQYKPSPFCILDEVDAPLDDANIGRFVRLLESLKSQTQIVLITHSRKTMEIADQLYGVTMEEPGVSKLVSVRFS
jgi:chromosome segregation protein